jgi:hypothetical protein
VHLGYSCFRVAPWSNLIEQELHFINSFLIAIFLLKLILPFLNLQKKFKDNITSLQTNREGEDGVPGQVSAQEAGSVHCLL